MSKKYLKKRYIFIVFIFFLLLINVLLVVNYFRQNREVVVSVSDAGFSPDVVRISQGRGVKFVNVSNNKHWPASDLHPTHEEYAEFDPKKEIEVGGEWNFFPLRVGKYYFHDHLYPHNKGVLYVEKTSTALSLFDNLITLFKESKKEKKVENSAENFTSLSQSSQLQVMEEMEKDTGSKSVWDFIQSTYAAGSGERGNIHDLAHFAGTLMYEDLGFEGISNCTTSYAFGCYHGFLDAAFKSDLSKLPDAVEACKNAGDVGTGPYSSCIHGIGHGVASYYGVKDLERSLVTCGKIPKSTVQYCADGVFMEFARNAARDFYRVQDPFYPCNTVDTVHTFSCGRNQTSVLMNRFGYSYEEVAKLCASSSQEDLVNSCADSLGFVAAYALPNDPKGIVVKCSAFESELLIGRCSRSAAGELIFQNTRSWRVNAPLICAELASYSRVECEALIQVIMRDYGRG